MKQFRIYYESLEQGANFIMPIIKDVVGDSAEIILVRRPKTATELNEGSIAALLRMTTPDALITGISDGIEYPLVLIEFTEAVTTEDHELQRTYGAIAAYFAGAYYLKLAGEKESEKEFGGATYNPYSTPKIFIDKVGYEGYIIAKWETEDDNPYTLKRNADYPSCPPYIDILTNTIQSAIYAFCRNSTTWYNDSLNMLKETVSYQTYRTMVDKATGAKELLDSWKTRNDSNLNKLRFFVKDTWMGAKINRFGHAMDPDRGILTFMSFLFSEEKEVYGIYALVRPRGNEVMRRDLDSLDLLRAKLSIALDEKDHGSLPEWLVSAIKSAADKATSLTDIIDFNDVWEAHIEDLTDNKVVMTLAYFLDGIYLNHNGVKLKWNKRKLIDTTDRNFLPHFASHFKFASYSAPTPVETITIDVDEDEVSYALIHRVLIPNGFHVISVSYPGAQGSMAILPEPEQGKAQSRKYIDVIATPPSGSDIDVLLNESKGMFTSSEVRKDVAKLIPYKTDQTYKNALHEALFIAQVIDKEQELRNIVIGVSFGVKSNARGTTWNPGNIDFIFRIKDRNSWAIGIFKQELRDMITTIEGNTDFPSLYKCNKE
ncbi:MAG: hypothetical protein IJB63_03705 [Alistipes sp.]|nr:hypothetical protein [Alistipes sp.]